jgi:hypothetical protein
MAIRDMKIHNRKTRPASPPKDQRSSGSPALIGQAEYAHGCWLRYQKAEREAEEKEQESGANSAPDD